MRASLINMITIEELEKTHQQVPIIEVKASSFREGRGPEFMIDDSMETFFSMPNVGDKCNCIFEGAKFITHIAIAFRKGNERQYGFRISSNDFLSSKTSEDYEVYDIMDFTGKNMEIISQGYQAGDIIGGSFSAYGIKAYTPKDAVQPKTTQFKTDFVAKTDIEGISAEPLKIQASSSLEFDPGAEKVIDEKENTAFESQGRGRVLRFTFEEKVNITAIEFVSRLPESKQQLLRVNSQDLQSLKTDETARYQFDPIITGNYVDVILNGNTVDEKNNLTSVKFFGYPSKRLDEINEKKRLEEEQKAEELKNSISQDD